MSLIAQDQVVTDAQFDAALQVIAERERQIANDPTLNGGRSVGGGRGTGGRGAGRRLRSSGNAAVGPESSSNNQTGISSTSDQTGEERREGQMNFDPVEEQGGSTANVNISSAAMENIARMVMEQITPVIAGLLRPNNPSASAEVQRANAREISTSNAQVNPSSTLTNSDLQSNMLSDKERRGERYFQEAQLLLAEKGAGFHPDLIPWYGKSDQFSEKRFEKARKAEGNTDDDESKEGYHIFKCLQVAANSVHIMPFLLEAGEKGAKEIPVLKEPSEYVAQELESQKSSVLRHKFREETIMCTLHEAIEEYENVRDAMTQAEVARAAAAGAVISQDAALQNISHTMQYRERLAPMRAVTLNFDRDKSNHEREYSIFMDKIRSDAQDRYRRDSAALDNLKLCMKLLKKYVEELIALTSHSDYLRNVCNGILGTYNHVTVKPSDLPLNSADMKAVHLNLKKRFGVANTLTSLNLLTGLTNFACGLEGETNNSKYLEGVISNSQQFQSMTHSQQMPDISADQLNATGMILALPDVIRFDFLREEAKHQDKMARENDYDAKKILAAELKYPLSMRVTDFINQIIQSEKTMDAHHRSSKPDSKKPRISSFETQAAMEIRLKAEKKASKTINAITNDSAKGKKTDVASTKGKCYSWLKNGECKNKTTTCPFSHLADDKPSATDIAKKSKTVLCNRWKKNGKCVFGDKCHYAASHTADNVVAAAKTEEATAAEKTSKKSKKRKQSTPVMITDAAKTEDDRNSSESDSDNIDCILLVPDVEDVVKKDEARAVVVSSVQHKKAGQRTLKFGWDSMSSTHVVEELSLIEKPVELVNPGKATGLGGTRFITHKGASATFGNRSMDYIKDSSVPNLLSLGKELQPDTNGVPGIAIFNHIGAVHFRSTPALEKAIHQLIDGVAKAGGICGEAILKNNVYIERVVDKRTMVATVIDTSV